MKIKDDIIKEFCEQLKSDPEFPTSILEELKQLLEAGETLPQEKIYEIIKKGCVDVIEGQKD